MFVMAFPCFSRKVYQWQIFICFVVLFIFGAFRYNFGLDYSEYNDFFEAVSLHSNIYDIDNRIEVGYVLLNYILPSFRSLLVITSALLAVTYYIVFYRYVPEKFRLLAIFLLYLSGDITIFFMFSGIRNAISICILTLSVSLIQNHKIVWYIIIMFFAASFHTSSFLVFPIAYIIGCITDINNKTSKLLIALAIILCVIPFDLLLSSGSNLILNYFDKYETYVDQASELAHGASLLVKFSNLIIIWCIVKGIVGIKVTSKQITVVVLGLLACYLPMLGPLDFRLSMYFGILMIPAITFAYSIIHDKMIKSMMLVTFVAYKSYSLFIVYMNSPYRVDKIYNHFFDLFVS